MELRKVKVLEAPAEAVACHFLLVEMSSILSRRAVQFGLELTLGALVKI